MTKEKVVIVGAGMGGLTAAAYLARDNYDVLILDKNDRIGGLVNTFEQDGFFFDAGPRAFVSSGMVKPILKDLGIGMEFLRNTISIGIEDELFYIHSMEALKEYKSILIKLFPENAADIEAIIAAMRKLSDYQKVLYQFDNPNFVDFKGNTQYILTELLPWTIKLLLTLRKLNRYDLPMEEFLSDLTKNQSLMDMLSQHFFRQTPTYFALGYFYVYLDYFYPKGGTGKLPGILEEKLLEGGSEFRLNTQIVEINPAQSKILDIEGNYYDYNHLIWAADLKTLFRLTKNEGLDADTAEKIESEAQCMFASKGAESSFILFIGVDRPPSFFRENGGEHMFYTPSKTGLNETNRAELQALVSDFENRTKQEVMAWVDKFCDLNTYEVSIPVLRDPSLAPEEKTGVMISCLFDYSLAEKIEEAGWMDTFKQRMEASIIRNFSDNIYKDFDQDILFKFSSTPLTINRVSGSSEGAITGWSFETEIPVMHRLKNITKSGETPIPNVYKAGQWAYAPAGVPIAMLTGWQAAQDIIKASGK